MNNNSSNPYGGSKSPDTHYVVWYGKDVEYYVSESLSDARKEYKGLLARNQSKNDDTPIYLVKTKVQRKVLWDSEDIEDCTDKKEENHSLDDLYDFDIVI